MDRRDVIRRGLGVVGSLSAVSLAGRLVPEDGAVPSGEGAPSAVADVADDAAAPPADDGVPEDALPTATEGALDDVHPAIDERPGDRPDDEAYEEVADQLRETHADRCQCPVCGGSMPGRG